MNRLLASAALLGLVATAAFAAPREKSEKASDSREKMICKRFVETGSLVKGTRSCKPKREWDAERENIRASIGSGSCASSERGTCN
ncbi:MAG: hypothetical protein JWP15_932 [Alphaproteobacteria bacterium]|nr:hypothetical protein [Alphaproteobacteria bacterium]